MYTYRPLDDGLEEGELVTLNDKGMIVRPTKKQTHRCPKCGKFSKAIYYSKCCHSLVKWPAIQIMIGKVLKVDNNGNGWVELYV